MRWSELRAGGPCSALLSAEERERHSRPLTFPPSPFPLPPPTPTVANTRALRHAAESVTDRMSNAQKSYESQLSKLESSYRAQVEAVKRQLDEEMNAGVALRDRITSLESELAAARSIVKEVPALRASLGKVEAALNQEASEARAAEERADQLEAALKAERAAVNDVAKKLKEAQTQLAVLSAEHKAARDEVASLREERRRDLENAKEKLTVTVAQARQDLENLHAKKNMEVRGGEGMGWEGGRGI
jgi:chromosome segregation ATPase